MLVVGCALGVIRMSKTVNCFPCSPGPAFQSWAPVNWSAQYTQGGDLSTAYHLTYSDAFTFL